MALVALSPAWSDAVALIGLGVTVAGFWVTLVQLRKTRSAALAAKAAAERAYGEGRRFLGDCLLVKVRLHLQELRHLADAERWQAAGLRASDLADVLIDHPGIDAEVMYLIQELRYWAVQCARLASGELKRSYNTRWRNLLNRLQTAVDGLRPQFPEQETEP